MAQLSGFTKAFNMSMNNMLTFAQMRQGQEQRKAQLKQQEFQNKISQASLLAPFFGKDNAPSVRRNALGQLEKLFPGGGIDFSKLSIDTPEFDFFAKNINKAAQDMRNEKISPEQFIEKGQSLIRHADMGTKRKKEELASLDKIVERYDKTAEAAKIEKIRMEKVQREQVQKIAEGMQWEAEQAVRERRVSVAEEKEGAQKAGVQYMLKDRSRVTSFDGGRTYRNEAGNDVKMPFGSEKISTTLTGADLAMYKTQAQAQATLDGKGDSGQIAQADDMTKIAEGGTGPFAMAAASVDAVLGGLGIDKLFGAKGIFSNTQENRQVLRTIKQMGKSALMISSRGPVYEQKLLDKLFPDPDRMITNPRTEAKKFATLRKILAQEKHFNLIAITKSSEPKAVSKLTSSNTQIDRLLSLIGTGQGAGLLSAEDKTLINKYAPKQ